MPDAGYPLNFRDRSRNALSDVQLQRALTTAMTKFTSARSDAVVNSGGNWERLRDRAREIKEHTINYLDHYLKEFAANVERRGGQIFWAHDAAEANEYIIRLARERGLKLAVKSKSMMTEEINLNEALAEAGVEAVETDLGEYIVQLAGERPSHINAPAIHKTRGDVADLFASKLDYERSEEVEKMTALARKILRAQFARAELGVSGVNFAVAETGTLVLVENEGNIRLTTSLPRTHVAVMGIEKVIPQLEDLGVFLQLLARSASGQKMTSYVSYLTGVKGSGTEEGPDELHVIILDNGRTEILADPHMRPSLLCIRCGACLNTCPVYRKIGGHAYGSTYPGPIGSVLTPQFDGLQSAADLPFASTLCGACREVCPVKIDIPDMLLHLRHAIKEDESKGRNAHRRGFHDAAGAEIAPAQEAIQKRHVRPVVTRTAVRRAQSLSEKALFKIWASLMKHATLYRAATRVVRLMQRLTGGAQGASSFLPLALRNLYEAFPSLAERSFRQQWRETSRDNHRRVSREKIVVESKSA